MDWLKAAEILITDGEYRRPEQLEVMAQRELAKRFGVEHKFFKRVLSKKSKSDLLSKEDIAKMLLDNSLVDSLEEGKEEVEELLSDSLKDFHLGYAKFREYKAPDGDSKYKLEYLGRYYYAV